MANLSSGSSLRKPMLMMMMTIIILVIRKKSTAVNIFSFINTISNKTIVL